VNRILSEILALALRPLQEPAAGGQRFIVFPPQPVAGRRSFLCGEVEGVEGLEQVAALAEPVAGLSGVAAGNKLVFDAGGRRMVKRMLDAAEPGSAQWFRAEMHKARLLGLEGKNEEAIDVLEMLLRQTRGMPDHSVSEATALLTELEAKKARTVERDSDFFNLKRSLGDQIKARAQTPPRSE